MKVMIKIYYAVCRVAIVFLTVLTILILVDSIPDEIAKREYPKNKFVYFSVLLNDNTVIIMLLLITIIFMLLLIHKLKIKPEAELAYNIIGILLIVALFVPTVSEKIFFLRDGYPQCCMPIAYKDSIWRNKDGTMSVQGFGDGEYAYGEYFNGQETLQLFLNFSSIEGPVYVYEYSDACYDGRDYYHASVSGLVDYETWHCIYASDSFIIWRDNRKSISHLDDAFGESEFMTFRRVS